MGGTSHAGAVIAGLDLRQRQVLRFVATYAQERGHLPAASEVAHGCGIGSNSTVVKPLRELEQLGLIERDTTYPRLGRVTTELLTCRRELELSILELAVHESRGNLEIVREALRWAPDAESIAFLHREGLARATLLRAYEDARSRLRDQGIVLGAEVQRIVDGQPEAIRARHALVDGWELYCVYSAAITLLARVYTTCVEPVGLALLEPVWVTEALVYDLERRLDRDVAVAHARADESAVGRLVHRVTRDVGSAFRALSAHFPEMPVPEAGGTGVLQALAG